jgi:hypothetical protein
MLKRVVNVALGLALIGMTGCSSDDCVATAPGVCVPANQLGSSNNGGSVGGTDGGTDGGTIGGTDGGAIGGTDGGTTSGGGVSFESFGTTPNGGHLSLDCTPNQIPAFVEHDCLYSHFQSPETVKCTLKMADRLGVVIGVATPVSFMAEAGAVSPVAVSPAYPATPDTLGHADGYLEVFASPLPADVDPMPGEVSASVDFGCGPRTANPRDGYVTVIAWVRGEEGFVDVNQNGKYDQGEPFVDQGEPFVDANDNGKWDPGEWFLDVNGDGQYTGPNGKWDADTIIWSQTRVVYTGLPFFAKDASGMNLLTRIYDVGAPPSPTPDATPISVNVGPPATTAFYGVFFTDALLNPLDPSTTYAASPVANHVTASLTPPAVPLRPSPDLFRILYCDKPQFPANCHDGPVESGCQTSPCYEVPEVGRCLTASCSGFQYGEYARLAVTAATVGPDVVWISAKVADHTTSFPFAGQALP